MKNASIERILIDTSDITINHVNKTVTIINRDTDTEIDLGIEAKKIIECLHYSCTYEETHTKSVFDAIKDRLLCRNSRNVWHDNIVIDLVEYIEAAEELFMGLDAAIKEGSIRRQDITKKRSDIIREKLGLK